MFSPLLFWQVVFVLISSCVLKAYKRLELNVKHIDIDPGIYFIRFVQLHQISFQHQCGSNNAWVPLAPSTSRINSHGAKVTYYILLILLLNFPLIGAKKKWQIAHNIESREPYHDIIWSSWSLRRTKCNYLFITIWKLIT